MRTKSDKPKEGKGKEAIVHRKRLTKVLMDGGSSLNILYVDTLNTMRIPQSELYPVLTFEVVDFLGSYHAILGRPCYAKFMAIPNYTYLKLKMLGPNGVITMGSTFLHAYMCDHEHYELAAAVTNSTKLSKLRNLSTLAVLDCNEPTSSCAFHPTEETKAVGIDPTDPTKMVWIGTKHPTK
ncbi:uncharacterized protein [Miscanthus floridulus]|uniref:uncharacterized protein n=1 Tax=Miscanthus floridulus TaxID=154761 RepID=UPI00345A137E